VASTGSLRLTPSRVIIDQDCKNKNGTGSGGP
jgi:hypothetical protein